MISSLTEHTRKCLKVKYLGRIEHYFQNSRVTGPGVGLGTKFRSEKIPRNILGMTSVIPRKKVLIPRHSEVYRRVYSEARNGRKWHDKISFTKNPAPANGIVFVRDMLQNGIPSSCLFLGMVQNRTPSVFF